MDKIKGIASLMTGWGVYTILSWLYDNPVWLIVVAWLGIWEGSILLSIGALIINFVILILYQRNGVDWLGVNVFEEIKMEGDKWATKLQNHHNILIRFLLRVPALFFRILIWALRKNNFLAFLGLSIHGDSFLTTIFLRGKVGGKLRKKDYLIFLSSTIFGCMYWTLRNSIVFVGITKLTSIIKILEWLFSLF